jgi:ABC-2 type transport system permease protein
LIGKMVPPVVIGMINGTFFLLAARYVFGVPFTGSLILYFVGLFVYLISLVGVGMLISAASQTQQQAFLGAFLTTVPVILLSGYSSPIDNMPYWLQLASLANPARHFLVVVEGLYLKAMPVSVVLTHIYPLIIIAMVTTLLSAWLFRARME